MTDPQRRLAELVTYPQEDLHTEVKGWLDLSDRAHQANLAKAMIAIANSGGGFILLGFQEVGGQCEPEEPRSVDLDQYTQDAVNGIVRRYAEPEFQCDVHLVSPVDSDNTHPVIHIPGGHKVPIRSKKDGPGGAHIAQNTYYLRHPGPRSEEPHSARDWDALIHRCILAARDELLDDIREIIQSAGWSEPE